MGNESQKCGFTGCADRVVCSLPVIAACSRDGGDRAAGVRDRANGRWRTCSLPVMVNNAGACVEPSPPVKRNHACPKLRMFIAVEVSPQVRKRAADLIGQLQGGEVKVSWVAPANMHITLKFLGDQTDDQLATICQAVQQAVLDVPPFEFSCQGAGAFPHCR